MRRRTDFHQILCKILDCPVTGKSCRVFFQPPASIQLTYPCIVYNFEDIDNDYANNTKYISTRRYSVILIDKNPDSEYIELLNQLPLAEYDRHYTSDNLYHDVFSIYF